MIVKLLTEHHLEFLSLKGGCRGSSKSTLVKMPNCWKSHAASHFSCYLCFNKLPFYFGFLTDTLSIPFVRDIGKQHRPR